MQGSWKIIKVEGRGPLKKDAPHVLIKGNTIDFGDTTEALPFQIDPTKVPKWITIELRLTKTVVESVPGIYKMDMDKLTICLLVGGRSDKRKRPNEFKAKDDKACEWIVVHLQQVR